MFVIRWIIYFGFKNKESIKTSPKGKKYFRYLFALKLEYMGKDRNIPSLTVFK